MPVYDYRCNSCGQRSALFYKNYSDYDRARDEGLCCPNCGSTEMTRLISRVTLSKPGRDYASMSSDEMLSVLEGGDSREVGEMMQQVGQDEVMGDPVTREVTERLIKGDKPEKIEKDIGPDLT
ncbi:MAG: zinc ribbon domain-containing protein [Anaerolineae bacterium]|nr:zinc ribbon domain-containing protein [Anaerolineae bacterium]